MWFCFGCYCNSVAYLTLDICSGASLLVRCLLGLLVVFLVVVYLG